VILPRLVKALAEHIALGQNWRDASIGSVFVCIFTECRRTRQFSSFLTPFHHLLGLYRCGVLPLSMVENSAFSPNRLTLPINPVYPSREGNNPFSSFQVARILMTLSVFLFLLVVFLLPCLAWLWHWYWLHPPPHSTAGARHPMVHRLLKPRTPRDCPACRLASTLPSGVGPAPLPVRPWHEVKSRRGAPKRLNTPRHAQRAVTLE
jgi:hypothetical protein